MKIFNRGDAAAAKNPTPTATPIAPALAAAAPAAVPAIPQPAPVAERAAPQSPDLTAILDANVKEMSEKIARLTSTIETQTQDRSSFEQKLDAMEERMRKLSSLTEMISAQYNPFVGDAPEHREQPPSPDIGLAPPPASAGAMGMALPSFDALPPFAEAQAAVPITPTEPSFDALAPAMSFNAGPSSLALEPPAAQPAPPSALPSFDALPPAHDAAPPSYEPSPAPEDNVNGVHVWNVRPGFESSMVLLGWADWLLKAAGDHDGLVALVNYYHNIGWIGEPARDQLLAYAEGLAPPAAKLDERDWRANMDVHERSLLFVEKLKALGARRSG